MHWVLAATLLVAGLLAGVTQVQAAATTKQIYGTAYTAQGDPVADASVYVTAPGDSVALYAPVITASDGSYAIEVTYKSTYDVHFEPDISSNLQPYTESNFYIHRSDAQVDAYLASTTSHTYSGTVVDANSDPVEGISVKASNAAANDQTTTDSSGTFSIQLSGDVYTVSLAKEDSGAAPGYPNFELAQDSIDLTAGDAAVDYALPAAGTATVTVYDRFSAPVSDQVVTFTGDNAQTYQVSTDANGEAVVPFLRASGIAEGALCVTFAQTEAVICNTETYDGSEDVTLGLYEPVEAILTGTITDSEGNPVADIHVTLVSETDETVYDAVSEQDGTYTLSVAPDEYNVSVGTTDSINSTRKHWSVFQLDQGILDLTSSDQTLDVALPAIHTLHIDVTGHDNTTLRVDANTEDGYIQSAFNNTGSANFVALDGQTFAAGTVCATYEASNAGSVCNTEPIIVDGEDITYTFVAPEMYKLNGQILNVDGTPAKNKNARLLLNGNLVVAAVGKSATFGISLTTGTYTVHALATDEVAGNIDEDMGSIDIVDAPISQNYQLSQ